MVSTSSITVQSLGGIELRALAVGAKMWCLYVFFTGRRRKNQHFACPLAEENCVG